MGLNGDADMRRKVTDCWNRDDQGVVWSFSCIAEQEGRIGRGEGRRHPLTDLKEGHSRRQKYRPTMVTYRPECSACRHTKDGSCLIARSLKMAVDSLLRPARCRVSST